MVPSMASSILAWKIPWIEEPGGLQTMGSQRVRHDWVTSVLTITKTKQVYFILLYFVLLPFTDIAFFNKWNVCGNSELSKSIDTIFSTAFDHFVSLYHMLTILLIFQTFSLLLYLLWWSVISDLQYWYCNFCF